MAINLSNLFGSDSSESNSRSETNAEQNADANASASNDGISVQNERSSRDEDGEASFDRTNLDTGQSDFSASLDASNSADTMTNSSSSNESSDGGSQDSDADSGGGSDSSESNSSSGTNFEQNADANADASNDGISLRNESFERDEDGEESHDSASIDTGRTDLEASVDLDSMIETMSSSSSSSQDTDVLDG